jgi:putative intracellular protease/amidase
MLDMPLLLALKAESLHLGNRASEALDAISKAEAISFTFTTEQLKKISLILPGTVKAPMEIAFLLYPGMTALDFVGPHEVLCRLPGAVIRRVSKQPGPVKTDSEVQLIAECGFGYAILPDVLVVPGAASATDMRDEPEILDWVRNAHAGTTWTTSVCTGSLILGAADVLSGLKATTHWAALDRLR